MNFILASIGVFLVTILVLVVILLVAKNFLVASGNVKLTINGDKEMEVESGSTLLNTLAVNGVFLPSACGGKGSCGQCKCQVVEGGGEILPSEVSHFSRKQQKDHWRLGCQVKVKGDMGIKVPESVMGVKEYECTVISNKNVATFIKEFKVQLPKGAHMDFIPGSYAQIKIPKFEMDYNKDIDKDLIGAEYLPAWEKFGLFGLKCKNEEETIRAYSMANYPAEGDVFMLTVRIATPPFKPDRSGFMDVMPGIASSYIFTLKPGDKVALLLRCACLERSVLSGRLPETGKRLPELPLPSGAGPSGPGSRCSWREVHSGIRSSGNVEHLFERPRSSGRHRILHVWSWSDVESSGRYAG